MRLIDADAFDDELDRVIVYADSELTAEIYRTRARIASRLTVDAEPVRHGRWVKNEIREAFFECSCCHCNDRETYPFYKNVWKYCPNCGAKMDGVKE